jgi:RIO-like serine/threonine protein kinase
VEIVARAEAPLRAREHCSLLVTAGLPDAAALNVYWKSLDKASASERKRRNRLIDRVARLIAQAHQSGFHHLDLHAGNILIQAQGEEDVRAVFVDLQNVRIAQPVTRRAMLRNLAQLNQWFSIHASLTDRWRFLRGYLDWRRRYEDAGPYGRPTPPDARAVLPLLAAAIGRHADHLYAKRDRVAMRTGRYFARMKLGRGWRAHVYLSTKHPVPGSRVSELEMTAAQWKTILSEPRAWLEPSERRMMLKNSESSRVCRGSFRAIDGTEVAVVCKSKRPKAWFKKLVYPFRRSRSMRTWSKANALLHRRILTARPLAVVERRWLGLLREDLLLTEYVADGRDLDTLLTVGMRSLSPEARRRIKLQLIEAILRTMRTLAERGFVHRDFKALNLLVQWRPEEKEAPRIVLVDLDGLKRARRSGATRAALRMMMRLNVSLDHCRCVNRTDRLRFLLRYLQQIRGSDRSWKEVWRELERASVRKRARRGRHQQGKLRKHGRI